MEQRVRFIGDFESCRYTMSELCRLYGISRKTGYKWADRFSQEGIDGLKDRSRAPRDCPHRTDSRCVEALLEQRRRHPRWGPRKLLVCLRRKHPDWPWPAPSTAGDILKRHGLVKPRRRRRRRPSAARPVVFAEHPNDLWTADFKGEFRTGDRQLCYPLTVMDHASRYLLECRSQETTSIRQSQSAFVVLFREFGLPRRILTDNGPPFGAALSPRRLSRMAIWWIKLGIEPVRIQPGHPEQNGAHERFHRTLKAETARPPAGTLGAQQSRFDGFRREYNEHRPHEALDQQVPTERYEPSPRPYPERIPEVEYPGHYELRRVRQNGQIKWLGEMTFVSEILVGETVGLEEIDEGLWSMYFARVLLGRYDERDRSFEAL